MGLNSLYYHEEYGSIVSIQALRIDTNLSDDKPLETKTCRMCMSCVKACPTNAITEHGFNRDKCLREMMDFEIPENHRNKLYQLFSCERCQRCCPENPRQKSDPVTMDISSILREEKNDEITKFCGTYISDRSRILRETILMAANNNQVSVIPTLKKLQADSDERVSNYARWAFTQLQ